MAEKTRGLLDTSVVVGLDTIEASRLPIESAIATLTLAELSAGLHATGDVSQRAARQHMLQYVEHVFQTIPFDIEAARAYGRIYAAVRMAGQKPRGGRAVDFLIAATALSRDLPLYTRNATDFASLTELVSIVAV